MGLLQLFLFLLAKQSVVSLCVMINGLIYLHWAMQAMQRYYRATSRELRRLDSVSRSHVYTTFTEVLDGSGTIRAFKAQVETLSPVPPKLSSSPKKANPHTMIITLGKTTLYQLTRRNPNL